MDLMRSDTLDWEQYPIIYNNIYNDTDPWTPEDIQSFQDAIYKSEKDFHQVSLDLGNKTVKQCVEFYYMWKKACPDDYRKLRNLRRKRQLLEMHQQV
uniref:SANT domain-containing protein n=1 Tax=Parascaris equorum TaxID=6256 RepID=A0A914RPY2_PAREQ